MKPIKVIAKKNLPVRLPFVGTAVAWLLLDRFDVDGVWRGVVYALVGLWWILIVVVFWLEEYVELPLDTLETWTAKRQQKGGDE